jgi:RimJ/RimL family protein N-acetyltransferase/L-amino acid N-acyltransferase YncA
MNSTVLRPAEPERDFGQLAAWFSTLEDERSTEPGLKAWYEKQRDRIIQTVAEDEQGELLGFYWATRDRSEVALVTFFLFVKPEQRGQGLGCRLFEDLVRAVKEAQARKLRVSVWDTCTEGLAFARRRGFIQRRHQIAMELNLDAFDDRPYDEIIARLKREGFEFTSMQELGNTEEAQRQLYVLNDTTSAETSGTDGEHSWSSFNDFQRSVCQSDWYKPDAQMVAIDTASGAWVAMSAITRLEGNDYAYNLFTGVDKLYRGRRLAQAVKVLALRYARDVPKANTVRTHHNNKNLPMIAIDLKLAYTRMSGTFLLEKILE